MVKRKKCSYISSIDLLGLSGDNIKVGNFLADRVTWPSISPESHDFFLKLPHISFNNLLNYLNDKIANQNYIISYKSKRSRDFLDVRGIAKEVLTKFTNNLLIVMLNIDYITSTYLSITI